MLRESILKHLKELRLEGMREAYDEAFAIGQKRGDTAERLLLTLLEAEVTERAGRSLRYRLGQARFPIQKEREFVFGERLIRLICWNRRNYRGKEVERLSICADSTV